MYVKPHEHLLKHRESGGHEGEGEERDGGGAIRPQPAQVLAHVGSSLAPSRALRVARLRGLVEAPPLVVPDEAAIALPRRDVHELQSVAPRWEIASRACAPPRHGGI